MNDNITQDESEQDQQKKGTVWKNSLVVLLFCILFYYMITPNVNRVGISPRTQSINNLKNLGLAQMNYASQSEGLFAPPTLYNEEGLPVHGWFTQLLPLLDETAIYHSMDLSSSWDDPVNQEFTKLRIRVALNPALDEEINDAGYPLIHYTLNERLFPGNESLTEDFISRADGLGNTILMGEIQEGLPAWGAPGNARDSAFGLKPGPNTFGVSVHHGFTIIGFADGRVRTLSNDIDPRVLKALSTPDGGEEVPEDY